MRPRIVENLNATFDTNIFSYLVPDPAFMYAVAIAVCAVIVVRRSSEDGLSRYHALGGVIWGTVGGLIGARVFFLLTHYERVLYNPAMLFDLNGATVSWGAYIGGAAALLIYFKLKGQPSLRYLDVIASCAGIGIFFGRISCFLNGDDYGTMTSIAWGVSFPHGSFPFAAQVKEGLIDPLASLSLPVHPVQLYGSLKGLALFIVFTTLWRRFALPAGTLFCAYWMAFSLVRFSIEFFRGDVSRGFIGPLSTGQLMSMIIFVCSAAAVGYAFATKRDRFSVRNSVVVQQ
ncbi:MAG: prolipoprotein diacylglyceryl transferase [Bacteroidetes bacterium]|nr:prolipoprotein diacylglyceryl transferase [Bacteroidota bacterium]MCW5896665.1 prolipoprotein diacylglyceryl transferase [Bacteroidota bacterium]